MNSSLISYRYAKAFFSLGEEKNQIDELYNNILSINKIIAENPELNEIFSNPLIKPSEKFKIFQNEIFSFLHANTINFYQLIFENKRGQLINDINRNFIARVNQFKNIKNVTLYTSKKVSDKNQSLIKDYLIKEFKSSIELICKEDPKIMGGFILMVDDKLLDLSVSKKLKDLEKLLIS